jgi:hypothetical protein
MNTYLKFDTSCFPKTSSSFLKFYLSVQCGGHCSCDFVCEYQKCYRSDLASPLQFGGASGVDVTVRMNS